MKEYSYLRSSSMYVVHNFREIPFPPPVRVLKRLCTVDLSAIPATAGAIRTKAFSPTSFRYNRMIIAISEISLELWILNSHVNKA